ncbi:cytochrome c biogenesis CcdA family protein [Mycolicibacter senuensis]|uniref:Putative integral membrane cytochrome c biogenesis protein n=1 Tax=Mycolicibacter senuensis TaxID=386913 RepID=A0A7I9XMD5_9MYCO|nr:cytochrome c biogenesis protein CcdA [Mycolicibacter senuensis]ORW66322.1 thiol-disulfide oxidoreductase [Mycolicibacter senuensis]GFG71135.1 putative integral membrane cytochrome c biogenesis protein [Mycolicibacter senuensis]
MTGVGVLGAFLGGLAALFSPCSALLLPSFFAYAFDRVQLLIRRTVTFWIGLCAALTPIGAGVGALGNVVTNHRSELALGGGLLLIGFGMLTALGKGFTIPGIQQMADRINIASTLSVLALGIVYGLAGFCAGPLLGAVLTMSAMGASPLYGALLMAVYALGMATPLFVLAWLWERFDLGKRPWLRGRPVKLGPLQTHTTSLITGVVLTGIGVLFIATDGTANLGGLLTVDSEYELQLWLSRVAAGASDVAVWLGVVVALLGWRVHRLWRRGVSGEATMALRRSGASGDSRGTATTRQANGR